MAPNSPHQEVRGLLTVNYQRLQTAQSPSDAEVVKLFEAVRGLGFFYLDLRPCPSEKETVSANGHENDVLEEAHALFRLMKTFFDLPLTEKQTYGVTNNGGYFGYKGMGKSFVDKEGTPDANEFYNLSKDDILDQLKPPLDHPHVVQAERPLLRAFVVHSHAIVDTLLRHISACLGLYPTTTPQHRSSADVLPSLHHLTIPSEDQISFIKYPGSDRPQANQPLASHTDYGTLTLLFTSSPGLQVLVPGRGPSQGHWLDVQPRDGHAIVNCGDALALFTNKLLRSNVHRVASQLQRGSRMTRYSLGYFARPGNEVLLRPLPGVMVPEDGQMPGEGVTSKEWVLRRSYGRLLECYEGHHTWGKTTGTEVTEI